MALPRMRSRRAGRRRRIEVHGLAAGAPGHLIIALAAQGGQDLTGQPLLEGQGTGLVAAGHEEIETGLGQEPRLLFSKAGHNGCDQLPFFGDMGNTGATVPLVAQRQGDVLGHEPGLAVFVKAGADEVVLKSKGNEIRHSSSP